MDVTTESRESVVTTPQLSIGADSEANTPEMDTTEIGAMFDGPDDASDDGKADSAQDVQEQPADAEAPQSQPQQPADEPTHKIKVRGEEREVPLSELKKLAEAGGDYTRQMQALAEQRRQVESLAALGEALRNDPGLRDHLSAYQRQGQQQAAQPPADPIERIKWEAEQTALAKVQEHFGPMLQQMQHQQRIHTTLAQVRQDPLMQDVYGEIHGWLGAMPEEFRQETYQRLDTDPDFFVRTYTHFRDGVKGKKGGEGGGNTPAPAQVQPDAPATPQPVKRETKAPLLEAPGAEQPEQGVKKRFSELKSRAYNGDTAALGAMFDM